MFQTGPNKPKKVQVFEVTNTETSTGPSIPPIKGINITGLPSNNSSTDPFRNNFKPKIQKTGVRVNSNGTFYIGNAPSPKKFQPPQKKYPPTVNHRKVIANRVKSLRKAKNQAAIEGTTYAAGQFNPNTGTRFANNVLRQTAAQPLFNVSISKQSGPSNNNNVPFTNV
jgi:hypothetical protein